MPRRGTSSACANKAYALDSRRKEKPRVCSEDASFTRSFDPCASILAMHRLGQLSDGGADELASRLGKLGQLRGTNTGVGSTDVARLATLHRFARRGREVQTKKRKEIEVSVPARIEVRRKKLVWLLARRNRSLQKSVGDNQVSNKLGKRTPKRVARVELTEA
jgi:hypothetical protein